MLFFYFQEATEFVFIPTESEKRAKTFHLTYNVTKDCYCRVHNNQEEIPGWEKGVYKNESVLRKEERDWQMVSVNLRLCNFLIIRTSLCLDSLCLISHRTRPARVFIVSVHNTAPFNFHCMHGARSRLRVVDGFKENRKQS